MSAIEKIMRTSPVIPVLVIDDAAHAGPIAEALVAGGIAVLEVTLRTPAALDVIREMAQVEGAMVGAGTVLNETDLDAALDAGALHGLADDVADEGLRLRIIEGPAVGLADRRAGGGDDDGFSHGAFSWFPAPRLMPSASAAMWTNLSVCCRAPASASAPAASAISACRSSAAAVR